MSLAIDIDKVSGVLLGGIWHVVAKQSFDLDSYEYVSGDYSTEKYRIIAGETVQEISGSVGFRFTDEKGSEIFGPLTSIQALRYAPPKKTASDRIRT